MPDEWWGSSHRILSTTPTRAGLASDGGCVTPGPRPLTTAPSFHAFCTQMYWANCSFPWVMCYLTSGPLPWASLCIALCLVHKDVCWMNGRISWKMPYCSEPTRATDISVGLLVTQLYLTLCDPMDCSPPGSSDQRILQARMLEWIAIAFSSGSSWTRDWTQVSCVPSRLFYHLSHQAMYQSRKQVQ